MFRIKRSNLLQSKEFWNEMTLPPLNNVSHLFRGGRVIQYGAGSGTRTHTMLPSTDFESVTSTNSIIPATGLQNIIHDIEAVGKSFRWRKIRK